MTEKILRTILNRLFSVPVSIALDESLVSYIQDSIDVGELVAELKEHHHLIVPIKQFQHVRTLKELIEVVDRSKVT